MFVSWQAAIYFFVFLLEKLEFSFRDSTLLVNTLNFVALYCVGLPILWLIIRTIPEKEIPEPPRPRLGMTTWRFVVLLIFCFGITYIVNFISTFIIAYIATILDGSQLAILQPASVGSSYGREIIISVFFTACVPGLLEEYVFRYLIYKKMRGSGDLPYILFSGITFGLFHGNFSQMFFAMAIGCIYAWIYTKTNVIWYSVGLHFLNNLFAAFILPLLAYSVVGVYAVGLFALSAIVVALVLGISQRKRVWAGLSAASEDGWPQKKEKSWQRKMQHRLFPLAYDITLKMMEYPPYSADKKENYEIAIFLQKQEDKQKKLQAEAYPSYANNMYAATPYGGGYSNAYPAQRSIAHYYMPQNSYAVPMNGSMYTGYARQTGYYGNYGYSAPYVGSYNGAYAPRMGNMGYYNPVTYTPSNYRQKKVSVVGFLLKNLGSILFIIAALISSIVYLLRS